MQVNEHACECIQHTYIRIYKYMYVFTCMSAFILIARHTHTQRDTHSHMHGCVYSLPQIEAV